TPTYSGGSDSYYWDRALCYSFQSGRDLGTDCMLVYPSCLPNPRPPLFPWFSLLVGRLLAPLVASSWNAVLFPFLLSTGLFGGLCVTVIALAWQGWAYVSVILIVWFAAELFLARFRNDDTMGTWILFALTLATPLALAFQWYVVRAQIRVWFDVPAYLYFAAFVLGLAFTVTRDYPWTLVIPSTLISGAVGLGVGVLVNPTLASAFFTGAGYF